MASSSNAPEEARPPELLYRKQQYRKNVDLQSANNGTCQNVVSNDTTCLVNQRSTRIMGLRNVLFPKRKISCMTSVDSERNLTDLSIIQMPKDNSGKIVSTVVALPNSTTTQQQEERPKTRHSVHLDVDEALSSLLWQPYEYQNVNNNNNNQDEYSLSSCDDSNCSCTSGSGGSSRSDLAKTQDNYSSGTTIHHTYGNNGNNMVAVDYLLDSNSIYSSRRASRRRTAVEGGCGGSRDGVALNVAYLTTRDSLYPYVGSVVTRSCTTPTTAITATSSLLCPQQQYLHGAYPNGGTMRTELSQPALVPTTPALLPVIPPRPNNNNHIVDVVTNNVPNMVLPLGSASNRNTTVAVASLHTANVVGIPQHSRQSSIPGTTNGITTTSNVSRSSTVIFPNHPRTASEPVPQQRFHLTTASIVPIQRQHVESHLRSAQTTSKSSRTSSSSSNISYHQPPLDLMTGMLKSDFNTPHQRAPLDLSIQCTRTTGDHLNIVHRIIPEQSKPQLSITHQRIPSDFNGCRGTDIISSSSTTAAVPSQLHITHQRTVSDIAQSSTARNDPINAVAVVATATPAARTTADTNNRMVPAITTNNANAVHHQRSSSIPNNSKSTACNNTGGILNVSNVNVNYYRAVPVNVVSAVPTIHCVNNNESLHQQHNARTTTNTNISNVNIIQAMPSTICNNNENDISTTVCNLNNKPTHSVSTTTLNSNDNNNGTTCTEVIVHNTQDSSSQQPPVAPPRLLPLPISTRTFTSTEAQTDEIISTSAINAIASNCSGGTQQQQAATTSTVLDPVKEQRRRERRERKHQRRMNNVNHRHNNNPSAVQQQTGTTSIEQWSGSTNPPQTNDRLPDILNSHLPPPYSSNTGTTSLTTGPPPPPHIVVGYHPAHHGILPHQQGLSASGVVIPPGGGSIVPPGVAYHGPVMATVGTPGGQVPLVPVGSAVHHSHLPHQAVPVVPVVPSSGFRFPFATAGFRRSRYSDDHPPKGCCGLLSWKPGSLRWFIALIALVAVCCVLVGTALGAMRPAGRDHLTVSLLMIGVGIVLVTVSAIAWRLTSHSPTTSCRTILGLSPSHSTLSLSNPAAACPNSASGNSRRFIPRLPPSYGGGRPHHPYAAMLYPEFQYRPPPPTYQASMQEYRLRLLLLDRIGVGGHSGAIVASPPPTYRSGYGPGGTLGSSSVGAGSLLRSTLSNRRALHAATSPPSIIDAQLPLGHMSSDYSTNGGSITNNNHVNGNTPIGNTPPHIILHSRDHSNLTLTSEPGGTIGRSGGGGVNVVSILNDGGGDAVRLVMNGDGGCFEVVGDLDDVVDDIKLDGGPLDPTGITSDHFVAVTTSSKLTEDADNLSSTIKDSGNLVTIVQTGDDQSPVIVTVGGGNLRTAQGSVLDHTHNMMINHHHRHHHQITGLQQQHYEQQLVNRSSNNIGTGAQITEIGATDGMEILAHL